MLGKKLGTVVAVPSLSNQGIWRETVAIKEYHDNQVAMATGGNPCM